MIKFNCPHCEIQIEAESEHAGASANCPSCEGDLVVPSASSEDEPKHTVDSSMQQESQSPPGNGTSEVLGSMRKKLGDLRDQIAASDAPRHAMEAMKKKATEIRDQVAGSELPRKALDSAKEKAAHLRDQVAASELPKEALDAARKKVSQARDYAATSETPKVALAWLKKSMVKPRYITVMLVLVVGLFAVNRCSKESIVPTARIEAVPDNLAIRIHTLPIDGRSFGKIGLTKGWNSKSPSLDVENRSENSFAAILEWDVEPGELVVVGGNVPFLQGLKGVLEDSSNPKAGGRYLPVGVCADWSVVKVANEDYPDGMVAQNQGDTKTTIRFAWFIPNDAETCELAMPGVWRGVLKFGNASEKKDATTPAVRSRREPVLEAPSKGKSGLEWEINRATSVLAGIYPELSKKDLISKLEEIYGKPITTISDAKIALNTLEQLKNAAIIAGESQRSFFNKSDESRAKFQKDVKRSRGPN